MRPTLRPHSLGSEVIGIPSFPGSGPRLGPLTTQYRCAKAATCRTFPAISCAGASWPARWEASIRRRSLAVIPGWASRTSASRESGGLETQPEIVGLLQRPRLPAWTRSVTSMSPCTTGRCTSGRSRREPQRCPSTLLRREPVRLSNFDAIDE